MLGGCGGSGGAGNGIEHLANGQIAGPLPDGVTDHTYVLDGAGATVNLPLSNLANKGRRVSVNLGAAGACNVNAALGENLQVQGGPFGPGELLAPTSAGVGLILRAATWQADGAGLWELVSNHVIAGGVV